MLKFKTSKGSTNDVGLGAGLSAVVVQPTADSPAPKPTSLVEPLEVLNFNILLW